MSLFSGSKKYLTAVSALALGLFLFSCTNSAAQPVSPPGESTPPFGVTTTLSDNSSAPTQDDLSILPDRVDIVYFHQAQRCPTCLCFEERVRYVVSTYFQSELDSGKMTFGIYDISDSRNTDIVYKYGAVGSQLFINTVKDGTDNIKDIQDIWSWNCRGDKPGFDQQVRNLIQQSLDGD
jgi:hypothetical protein